MNILFIGNFQKGPGGENADEFHLARELERQGHTVYRVPRDEWREYVIEEFPENKYKVPELPLHTINIVLIAKWHHFYDRRFVSMARSKYAAPVFYWVWDRMNQEPWHMEMAKAADLYLSGELGDALMYKSNGIKFYYFQFDSTDGDYFPMHSVKKDYDVVYLGSHSNQGERLDVLRAINKEIPITIFAYDHEEWKKDGFANVFPAVYGLDFNRVVAHSKIVLGTSGDKECFGYWSNRVGKVLYTGGFLLQWYTPGMELFLADSCDYFSTPEEAIAKIRHYLSNPDPVERFYERNVELGRVRWTSEFKIRQLLILIDRYLNDPNAKNWKLP